VALPLAMIMMVALAALTVAFAVLAQSEPIIAANHTHVSQARSLADSGIQRAIWALTNPGAPGGIAAMASGSTADAPYDGSAFVTLGSLGGFVVRVARDVSQPATERTVTAVGWLPTKDAANTNPHRKVQVVLQQGLVRWLDPPCAICVAGDTQVGGSARVDSRENGCGGGTPPTTAVRSGGTTHIDSSGDVYGYGNDLKNEPADYADGSSTAFFTYTAAELAKWKSLARQRGTYYTGAVTSIPASGIVFIDTTTGAPFTEGTPDSEAGTLTLAGGATFDGIIIVAGSVTVTGSRTFNGLIYALNDLTLGGSVTVNGAIASENRKDTSFTNIDSSATGAVRVSYNCDYVRNGGSPGNPQVSTAWTVKDGTYFETQGY
jgi:hypothetical protein